MLCLLILVFAFSLVQSKPNYLTTHFPYDITYHPTDARIINGTNARPGQFPWQVALLRDLKFHCGGSIIGEKWVLTAAHCLEDKTDGDSILAGTTHVNQNSKNNFTAKATKIFRHPDFKWLDINKSYTVALNDIALIELDRNLQFNVLIQPIALSTATPKAGTQVIVSGWGRTELGVYSEDLKFAITTIGNINNYTDPRFAVGKISSDPFTNPSVVAGSGDSGGPVVAIVGRYPVLVGIVQGAQHSPLGHFDIYTDVAFYRDWIRKISGI